MVALIFASMLWSLHVESVSHVFELASHHPLYVFELEMVGDILAGEDYHDQNCAADQIPEC